MTKVNQNVKQERALTINYPNKKILKINLIKKKNMLINYIPNLHCLLTDHGHFPLFSELLELVGFFSHFDDSLFHIIQSLREDTSKHIAVTD